MRKFILSLLVGIFSISSYSQSIDEQIGNAMNASNWFALDSLYNSTPKDSINPFLEIFSRCLIGNRFNRPDISIPAFQELLNSGQLDLGNLVSSVHMFGMDLSRIGYNAEAASMTNSVLDATKQYLDSATFASLSNTANRYTALSNFKPYQIEMPDAASANIPFEIVPVGPKDKGSVLMHISGGSINGIEADITFDTGAGVNIISPEMAKKFNLIPLENSKMSLGGVGYTEGQGAIAKELKLGDITVRDVPFVIINQTSFNEEADQYIDVFNIVIGSELMLQLKDLTLDFINHTITVPANAPIRSNARPNMCFSSSMNLLTEGKIFNQPNLMCLDSGDAAFGSAGVKFFEANKGYIEANGRQDTIRNAGIAGVVVANCYYVSEIPITIGGQSVTPSEFVVIAQESKIHSEYDVRIGLRTMMLYKKLHFNMVDFVISAE